MQPEEIFHIGRELRLKKLMRTLFDRCKDTIRRQTLNLDTVYRAFSDVNCNTELLTEIRQQGKMLLDEIPVMEQAA